MSFSETNNSITVDNPCRLCMEDLIEYYAIDSTIQNIVAELLSIQITIEVKYYCFFVCLFVCLFGCLFVCLFVNVNMIIVILVDCQFIVFTYVCL